MNIEDMIMNGASDEEINEVLNQIKAEKARQEEALRVQNTTQKMKEELKCEGRAYLINALISYAHAFDLLDVEEEELTQEDVERVEALIKKIENMIPMYIKLIELQGDLDKDFGLGFSFGMM